MKWTTETKVGLAALVLMLLYTIWCHKETSKAKRELLSYQARHYADSLTLRSALTVEFELLKRTENAKGYKKDSADTDRASAEKLVNDHNSGVVPSGKRP